MRLYACPLGLSFCDNSHKLCPVQSAVAKISRMVQRYPPLPCRYSAVEMKRDSLSGRGSDVGSD